MRIRNLVAATAAMAAFGASFASATAAMAQTTPADDTTICGAWTARGATGTYPIITFGGKPAGTEIGEFSATLVKPTEGKDPGVEFARFGMDIKTEGPVKVTVDYDLSEDADFTSGAVRLFGYTDKNPNTITQGPTWVDMAGDDSGKLSFTVTDGKSIGSLGLVYDASNSAKGSVTFSNLTIGGAKVSFLACPEPEPTETATVKPTDTATPKPTGSSSATPVPTETDDNAGPTLPLTGPSPWMLASFAVFLIGLGVVSVYSARRKRRFTA
jgi:hypothetical protein